MGFEVGRRRRRQTWAVLTATGALIAGCSDADDDTAGAETTVPALPVTTASDVGTTTAATATTATETTAAGTADTTSDTAGDESAPAITAPARFEGFGSVQQAYALGAEEGQELLAVNETGEIVGRGTADDLGSVLVRDLEPGKAYTFRTVDGDEVLGSSPFEVLAPDAHPDASFYDSQELEQGLNYLVTRDGVELAATVRLPPDKTLADGPFPTLIEYSGYQAAAPGDLLGSILDPDSVDPKLPLPDTSTAVGAAVAPLLGFASVSLQMRGTGCSGGAFGLFDRLAGLDGYDAIETVAAQPWVKGRKVGMIGISFSGISQLIVAGTQPPSLAAIAPLSVTDDLYSTGYPGGILNTGFATSWLADRVEDAKPAHKGGQEWAKVMIEQGDKHCDANQALHGQAVSVEDVLEGSTARVSGPFDERSPRLAAENISAPTFIVGALHDEQTGGQWVEVLSALDGNPDVWATVINGTHVDSLGPGTVGRLVEFLDLYVADELPTFNSSIVGLAPALYGQLVPGAPAAPVNDLRFADAASTDAARKQFAKDPRVRVLFDNGGDNAGDPVAAGGLDPNWELAFGAWPPRNVDAVPHYLGDGGSLSTTAPAQVSEVSYRPDPKARPATSLGQGKDPWDADPGYKWAPITGDGGLGFQSAPLDADTVVVGPGSLDLLLQSTADDTDIQVTVSDVRPDGQEMLVQTGQLRASHRALDESRSTELFAAPTYLPDDAAPLEAGAFNEVRVPINAFAYAFRAGSRIRVTISAPGGERPSWTYGTPDTGGDVENIVSLGGDQPSKLVLPVVRRATAGAPLPACPSLRGQPCRSFEPAGNGG